jgi:hypothetical protein
MIANPASSLLRKQAEQQLENAGTRHVIENGGGLTTHVDLLTFAYQMEPSVTNTAKLSFPRKRESSRFVNVFWTPACAGVTIGLFHCSFKKQ